MITIDFPLRYNLPHLFYNYTPCPGQILFFIDDYNLRAILGLRIKMIILHGIYDNGKVEITDKNLPNIRAEIEIILKEKSWQRDNSRIKLQKQVLASDIIVNLRSEN